jgi:hypothetical protein
MLPVPTQRDCPFEPQTGLFQQPPELAERPFAPAGHHQHPKVGV